MKKVLFVIQNLSNSGSPRTFLHLIQTLYGSYSIYVYVYAVKNYTDLELLNEYRKYCKVVIKRGSLSSIFYRLNPKLYFLKIKKYSNKKNFNLIITNNAYFASFFISQKSSTDSYKVCFYSLGSFSKKSRFRFINLRNEKLFKTLSKLDCLMTISSNANLPDYVENPKLTFILIDYVNPYKLRKIKNTSSKCIKIGQIGYYCDNKNQLFSIKVLKELISSGNNASIVFIGYVIPESKKYYNLLLKFIKKEKLEQYVTFLPSSYNKQKFFEDIDFLFMPSKSEGLGLALFEAQFSNIRCIASSNVAKDTELGLCKRIDLNEKKWAQYILETKDSKFASIKNIYTKRNFEEQFKKIINLVLIN